MSMYKEWMKKLWNKLHFSKLKFYFNPKNYTQSYHYAYFYSLIGFYGFLRTYFRLTEVQFKFSEGIKQNSPQVEDVVLVTKSDGPVIAFILKEGYFSTPNEIYEENAELMKSCYKRLFPFSTTVFLGFHIGILGTGLLLQLWYFLRHMRTFRYLLVLLLSSGIVSALAVSSGGFLIFNLSTRQKLEELLK